MGLRQHRILLPWEVEAEMRNRRRARVCFWIAGLLGTVSVLLAIATVLTEPLPASMAGEVALWQSRIVAVVLISLILGYLFRRG